MVYALQKFIHYSLGKIFKMFTDHYAVRYLVNKTSVGGNNMHMFVVISGV
jgi:hypothetical protein